MIQPDLFDRPRAADAEHGSELFKRLYAFLVSLDHWATRREIAASTGLNDREIREARENSQGLIIFGQRGFRATCGATLEEIAACANTYESQARAMIAQAVRLRRLAHGRIA